MVRRWLPAVAIAFFTVVVSLGFLFAKVQADNAIRVAKRQAVAEAQRESERADEAICRIAVSNRANIIAGTEGLLALIRNPVPNEQPDRAAARVNAIRELERQLANARRPFPPPCDTISL